MSKQLADYHGETQREFLTFTLGGEFYGVDILKVREVRAWEQLRELHDVPAFIKGVLDLRGKIVPIVDLRMRFDIGQIAYTATTVIIVLEVENGEPMGIVVDGVSDVLIVASGEIRPAPDLGSRIQTDYVQGMVNNDSQMVMLIDAARLLDTEEFEISGRDHGAQTGSGESGS